MTLSNKGQILTVDSKATCPVGGPDCITVDKHGQKGAASKQDAKKVDEAAANAINPVADMSNFNQEQDQEAGVEVE